LNWQDNHPGTKNPIRIFDLDLGDKLATLLHGNRKDTMKEHPETDNDARAKRRFTWKPLTIAAAIIAVIQSCLTIEGRGIEGFVLWVLILFVAYWLLFTFLAWLWQRYRGRS
jgi:hypothetical protein